MGFPLFLKYMSSGLVIKCDEPLLQVKVSGCFYKRNEYIYANSLKAYLQGVSSSIFFYKNFKMFFGVPFGSSFDKYPCRKSKHDLFTIIHKYLVQVGSFIYIICMEYSIALYFTLGSTSLTVIEEEA